MHEVGILDFSTGCKVQYLCIWTTERPRLEICKKTSKRCLYEKSPELGTVYLGQGGRDRGSDIAFAPHRESGQLLLSSFSLHSQ